MSNSNFRTIPVRAPDTAKDPRPMTVTSDSFADGETIPNAFVFTGCGGQNQSPQLSWSGVPNGAKSFAITCFDPDAPTGCGYWHWVTFNLPAHTTSIVAGSGTDKSPAGGRSGYNDFGATAYAGPCPPKGDSAHTYVFTVYALDVESVAGADERTTGATLLFKMRGHVLASGSLSGRFGH